MKGKDMTNAGTHVHGDGCGHPKIKHGDHFDYLDDGHLADVRSETVTEHSIEVTEINPDGCQAKMSLVCFRHHDGNDHKVPHGDHIDFLYHGRLHHVHGDHCDDHGPVEVT